MDSELTGTTPWMVIPRGRHRYRYELPLWMFTVVKDVFENVNCYPLGLEAVREEILERLSRRQDYTPESAFISLQFLTDFRSSLNHPVEAYRPWPYNRWDDESSEESSSDDSEPGSATMQPTLNESAPETNQEQEPSDEDMDDPASDVSMTSFHSTQETTNPDEAEAASFSASNTAHLPEPVTSSDSGIEDRHWKLLQATFQFLQLQLKILELNSESRQHQRAKNRAQKEMKNAQPDQSDSEMDAGPSCPANPEENPETLDLEEAEDKVQRPEIFPPDDLDSLFESEEE